MKNFDIVINTVLGIFTKVETADGFIIRNKKGDHSVRVFSYGVINCMNYCAVNHKIIEEKGNISDEDFQTLKDFIISKEF